MGVSPVGYGQDNLMPGRQPPWGSGEPDGEPLDLTDGVPLEAIAALDPDLILATFSIGDRATYDKLSKIAPTVAGRTKDFVADWPDLVETAGEILDEADKATDVRQQVDAKIDQVSEDLPQLSGRSFAVAQYIVGDSLYVVADPDDGSSQLFR